MPAAGKSAFRALWALLSKLIAEAYPTLFTEIDVHALSPGGPMALGLILSRGRAPQCHFWRR